MDRKSQPKRRKLAKRRRKVFNRIIIRPYSSECGGARDIVKLLTEQGIEAKRVYSKIENFTPEPGDFIVNWGASYPPEWQYLMHKSNVFLNHWTAVANSVSKTRSFENFKAEGVPHPKFTTERNKALEWSKDGKVVCVRQLESSYDGKGLILAKKPDQIEWAPLYTQFVEDSVREYRAYIVKGKLIDLLYKYAPAGVKSDVIRTETNGWEYGRSSAMITPEITEVARLAIAANKMDFGGVDIIEDNKGKLFALETNSEPGIGLITAQKFAKAFRELAGL